MFAAGFIILSGFLQAPFVWSEIIMISDIQDFNLETIFPSTLEVDDNNVIQTTFGIPLEEIYDLNDMQKLCVKIQALYLKQTSTLYNLREEYVKILKKWSINYVLSPTSNIDEAIQNIPADWEQFVTFTIKDTGGRKKQMIHCYPLYYEDTNFVNTECHDENCVSCKLTEEMVDDIYIAPADQSDLTNTNTPLIFYKEENENDQLTLFGFETEFKFVPKDAPEA